MPGAKPRAAQSPAAEPGVRGSVSPDGVALLSSATLQALQALQTLTWGGDVPGRDGAGRWVRNRGRKHQGRGSTRNVRTKKEGSTMKEGSTRNVRKARGFSWRFGLGRPALGPRCLLFLEVFRVRSSE